jgi:hypothetical protein
MNDAATSFPLYWPTGRARTPQGQRERAPFGKRESVRRGIGETSWVNTERKALTIADARARLQREVDLLRATKVVLSTNVELRLDGAPRSDRRPPDDPGVALWFEYKGVPTVLACDRFTTVADNIAAIASHIDGMRKAERHGVGSLEQMFRGFTALPGATSVNDWRRALGEPCDLDDAETTYREWMRENHPDVCKAPGAEARAAEMNAAIALARKWFAP